MRLSFYKLDLHKPNQRSQRNVLLNTSEWRFAFCRVSSKPKSTATTQFLLLSNFAYKILKKKPKNKTADKVIGRNAKNEMQ